MKLEFLQFLELERFTRFGARVEPATEKKLQRGRCLRAILKQERFAPLPALFQLAWMIAFNQGLLEKFDPADIKEQLHRLMEALPGAPELDEGRETWVRWLSSLWPEQS